MSIRETSPNRGDYDFVPTGAARYSVEPTDEPKDYLFVLTPSLTMLALSAAIEPLRIANQLSGQKLYRWYTASHGARPVSCSNGLTITPDLELPERTDRVYSFVCSGVAPERNFCRKTLNWIRQAERFGGRFGSICTGAYYLARAGILNDRKFTLHWENQAGFVERFPGLRPTNHLYEMDKQLFTCGGGSASADMMLRIIQEDFGRKFAAAVAEMCLHNRCENAGRLQKSPTAAVVGNRNPKLLKAIDVMRGNLEEPLNMDEIASRVNSSRRQLERLFKKYCQTSPRKMYCDLRLDHAHALLLETDIAVQEIASATGFGIQNFSLNFRKKFGASPCNYKASWR